MGRLSAGYYSQSPADGFTRIGNHLDSRAAAVVLSGKVTYARS